MFDNILNQLNFETNPEIFILGGFLFLFWIIQIVYYLVIYNRPYRYEKKREKIHSLELERPSVSVIIASKNEAENIAVNLPLILEQKYENFEVIVVNMGSTDETDTQLKLLGNKYSNLYHTYVPDEAEIINEKKLALTLGIKAAKNDILLFTEAYCKPATNLWIEQFAYEFEKGNDIVLGFCKLNIDKKVFRRRYILYDNLIFSLKYLSMAIFKKPFMGINRNLAYKRDLFFKEKGFSSVLSAENGEDDLYINKISKGRKVGVVVSPDSMTESDVVEKFSVWKNLKSKYLYTKKQYEGSSSFIFGFESFSKYLFYLLAVAAVVYGISSNLYVVALFAALLFLIRYLIQLTVLNRYNKTYSSGVFHLNLLFLDLLQPVGNFRMRKTEMRKRKHKR